MSQLAKFALFAPLGLLLAAAGCTSSSAVDAKMLAEYRTRLALVEEPDGVQTVSDIRSLLVGEGHDHDGDGQQDHAADDHATAGHGHEDHGHVEAGHDADGDDHEGHDHDGDGHQDHAAADHATAGHNDVGHDTDGHNDAVHDINGHDDAVQQNNEHGHVGHDKGESDSDKRGHDEHAHATESLDVAMIGHIGGLANPWAESQPDYPFAKTQAVFFLADPQAIVENESSGHSHAPGEECAFCLAHAADQANMLARVQFVDKNGNVLPMDVRQLFDVKEQDTVVVRGKARVTAGGILVVDADGLYIRR